MSCFIKCPECSKNLGELYPVYKKIKEGYYRHIYYDKKNNIHISKIDLKANIAPNTEYIFDALHINNICCRMHILGTVDSDSMYF